MGSIIKLGGRPARRLLAGLLRLERYVEWGICLVCAYLQGDSSQVDGVVGRGWRGWEKGGIKKRPPCGGL